MDTEPGPNLETFYRTMTTPQLELYRKALALDRTKAQRKPPTPANTDTIAFASARIALIDRVLGARGIVTT